MSQMYVDKEFMLAPSSIQDGLTGDYGSERRFPFVFAMPMQFYSQADVIAYLKGFTKQPTESEDGLNDKVWNNWQAIYKNKTEDPGFIKSSKTYTDAQYGDALTPNRAATQSNISDKEAEALGIDPLFTRPNQSTTEIGGNDAINCYWQFGWDDDLVPPMLSGNKYIVDPSTGGLGRVYSEMINSNQQLLSISIGVPRYTRLLRFYSNLFSKKLNDLNTNGDNFPAELGRLVGTGLAVAASMVVAPWRFFMDMVNFVSDDAITKYVDFHETMLLYYRYVNAILIELAVGMGLMPKFFNEGILSKTPGTGDNMATQGTITNLEWTKIIPTMDPAESVNSAIFPIFKGGFDIYKILAIRDSRERAATSDPRIFGPTADAEMKRMRIEKETVKDGEVERTIYRLKRKHDQPVDGSVAEEEPGFNFVDLWDAYRARQKASWQGADKFISFKLEKSTDSSESISNQTGESTIQSTINNMSDSARSGREWVGGSAFSSVKREVENVPLIGGIVGSGMDALKGLVDGLLTILPSAVGAVQVLSGDARVDIPEVWQASSFSKSHNFNITLRAPYGDPYTVFQSVYIPLVMLIAMALPRASGENSYQQPFVVRAYSKGMFAIPYGIIDSMTIRRGASEFGWSRGRLPTVVEVSFSIRDLSPSMIMPMDLGASVFEPWNLISNLFASNSNLQEYIQTLSGMGLTERLLMSNNIKRRLTVTYQQLKSKFTPEYLGFMAADSTLGRVIGAVSPYSSLPN